ncbi:MAG TPA: hypothetical protein DCW60_03125 [Sutterella sp.]|nr:hypothetical protein [Sutterella sp.]
MKNNKKTQNVDSFFPWVGIRNDSLEAHDEHVIKALEIAEEQPCDWNDIEAQLNETYGKTGDKKRFCIVTKRNSGSYIMAKWVGQAEVRVDGEETEVKQYWRLEWHIRAGNETYQSYYATPSDKDFFSRPIQDSALEWYCVSNLYDVVEAFSLFYITNGKSLPESRLNWHPIESEKSS